MPHVFPLIPGGNIWEFCFGEWGKCSAHSWFGSTYNATYGVGQIDVTDGQSTIYTSIHKTVYKKNKCMDKTFFVSFLQTFVVGY